MKNHSKLYLASIFLLILSNCKSEEPQTPPVVVTFPASEISLSKAKINGEVTNEGFSAATERGFVMSETNPKPTVSDIKHLAAYGKGPFSKELDNLKVNTKYYFAAFATNTKGTSYGEILNFTTADYLLATLTMEEPKNITYTTVQLTGTVTDEGGVAVEERGFCIGNLPNPTTANIKIVNGKGLGTFSTVVTQLKDESIYYVRSYAVNGKGISYGKEFTFKTLSFSLPTIETGSAIIIGSTSSTITGSISSDGGTELIEKGFVLSSTPNPTIENLKIISTSKEIGKYEIALTGLKANTNYYFKAYAINKKGVILGSEETFTTLNATLAKVSTNDFADITENSVRAGLEIDNDGGSPITEYGICYSSSNSNPTINDKKVIFGFITKTPIGLMNLISGLSSSSKYYLKGYAINEKGVSYGPVKTFSTLIELSSSVKNSIVAYYPFNGNSLDKSGNNLHLTETNITYTFDRYGNTDQSACYFNGGSSYLIGPSLTSITKELSIVIWVKNIRTSSGNWGCLITTQNSTKQGFLLQDNENLRYDFSIANLNGTGYTDIWTNSNLKVNIWEVLICTYDGNKVSIYKNGQLETEMIVGSKAISSTANLMIGSRYFNEFFKGSLDDIGIWNRVLKPEEINYLSTNSIKY